MSYIDQIDPNRQMMIYGSVTRDLSKMTQDPHHAIAMDMAQQSLNPAFLRLADPVEEAMLQVQTEPFLEWLIDASTWEVEFFADMQCMSQTAAGEKLLTTWLSGARFWSMLHDGCGSEVIAAISAGVKDWRSLGLDEVYFDLYVRGSRAVAEQIESAASPVAV